MSEERRFTSEDLALFAMQLLSKEEMAEVAAEVAQSDEARRELAEIQGDLAIYAHTADMHSPPAQARERLLKQVAREKKAIERAVVPERGNRAELVYGSSSSSETAAGNEGYTGQSNRGLGSGAYLTEDDTPKRSFAGKVFPWVGWAVAAGLPPRRERPR